MRLRPFKFLNALIVVGLEAGRLLGDELPSGIQIHRSRGPIVVDGDLSDPGWQGATRTDVWYETKPGDNVPPRVANVGYLAYDARFLYAGFEFADPDPHRIRAPLGDRDTVVSGDTDYAGVILDTRNDGKTGILLLANPRGIQYDAVSDDVTGNEDSSPDFFWSSAARITERGWVLEIAIPFSSLRYGQADPQTWGIMLYRNYPREYRYQFFSTSLPRGGQCFICRSNKLTGLSGLPSGRHLVLAPYVSGSRQDEPAGGVLGAPLQRGSPEVETGLDAKWNPGANHAIDVTLNPDFSQIESDVAQIGANERFALLFPEKRPFFLEGVELFSTPIQAVYTRTITSPRWGSRATGKAGATAYTALFAQDRGGGSVVIPGSNSSDLADQEFRSFVALGRVRRDIARSFVSLLATDREIQGGGYNRVLGPDFQWRPNDVDTLTGQILFSASQTPERPDLAGEWDGRRLSGHGASAYWLHTTRRVDLYTDFRDFTQGFRADDGFVPQVGYRRLDGEYGYTLRPEGVFRRLRPFVGFDHYADREGAELLREAFVGAGFDARWGSTGRLLYVFDDVRTGELLLPRRQLMFNLETNPSRLISGIGLEGFVGQEIDFDNHRVGSGASLIFRMTVRPTDHLDLRFDNARRWLDVDATPDVRARLFTARVDRLRLTYAFTPRALLRVIGQYVETRRDPSLYLDEVDRRSGDFGGSVLFSYKVNWQTLLFAGYGDEREVLDSQTLEPSGHSFFLKISYAFQR